MSEAAHAVTSQQLRATQRNVDLLLYGNDSQPVCSEAFKKTFVHCYATFFLVDTTF